MTSEAINISAIVGIAISVVVTIAALVLIIVCICSGPKKFSLPALLAPIVIGAVFIVAGIVFTAVGFDDKVNGNVSSGSSTTTRQTPDGVYKVCVDAKAANVEIETTEVSLVTYTYVDSVDYKVERSGGIFRIVDERDHFFHIFNWNDIAPTIKIQLPAKSLLEFELEVEVDAGNVKINAENASKAKIDANAGNVTVKNVKTVNVNAQAGNVETTNVATLTANLDLGNLTVSSASDSVQADVSAGNIKFNSCSAKNYSLEVNMGNVEGTIMGSASSFYIDCDVSMGSCNLKNGGSSKTNIFKAEVDMGNIKVTFVG